MRLIIILLLLLSHICRAQKEDYIWLSGYDSNVGYDTVANHYLGINKLDFNYTPRLVTYDSTIGINFGRTVVSYSDSTGSLLFYSNGIEIRNRWDEVIQNSRKMNDGWLINSWDTNIAILGYRLPQAVLALPIPNKSDDYLFFQCFLDSNQGITDIIVPKVLITHLSMSQNLGHGYVLYRDSLLLTDTFSGYITACKHANGRDWWILAQKLNSNCYYRILLTEDGAQVMSDQTCAGVVSPYGGGGASCFSNDGSKYAVVDYLKGILLYDFNRCEGKLYNPHNYPIPALVDSGWTLSGSAFSPDSRFLFVSIGEYLLQFDTWQTDPLSNPDTIARFDGFADPFGSYYCQSQLGPDGKIYIASGNGESNLSVIDSPDQKGQACHFIPHGLHTIAYQLGPPNNPNYRLGILLGSPCDTLTALREINSNDLNISVYPNPSQSYFIVDYGNVNWSIHDELVVSVIDITGQTIYTSSLPQYSALHKVNSSSFASGIYLVRIEDSGGRVLAVKRVVKE